MPHYYYRNFTDEGVDEEKSLVYEHKVKSRFEHQADGLHSFYFTAFRWLCILWILFFLTLFPLLIGVLVFIPCAHCTCSQINFPESQLSS